MTRINALLSAVMMVESGGDPNKIGDHGQAIGVLQIRPCMVEECNRILGCPRHFTLADRKSTSASRAMFRVYMSRWGRGKNLEVMSRRWNGGPMGEKRIATKIYWRKVQREIKCLKNHQRDVIGGPRRTQHPARGRGDN